MKLVLAGRCCHQNTGTHAQGIHKLSDGCKPAVTGLRSHGSDCGLLTFEHVVIPLPPALR